MSDFLVTIGYRVDSSGLKKAREEVNKTNQALGKTGKTAEGSSKKANAASKSMIPPLGGVSKAAGIAGVAIAAIGSAALVAKKGVDEIVEGLQEVQKVSDFALFTGAAETALAELEARAISSGVEFGRLSDVLTRQQEKLQEGNKIFEQLGLSINRLELQGPTEAFQSIVNAINDTDDAALRARGITQLLGESNKDALKLAGSVGEVRAQLQRAQDLGLVISQDDIDNANELDDATNDISAATVAIKRQLLDAFGDEVVAAARLLSKLIEGILPEEIISEALGDELERAKRAAEELFKEFEDNGIDEAEQAIIRAQREIIDQLQTRKQIAEELEEVERRIEETQRVSRLAGANDPNRALFQQQIADLREREAELQERIEDSEEDSVELQEKLRDLQERRLNLQTQAADQADAQADADEKSAKALEDQASAIQSLLSSGLQGFENNIIRIQIAENLSDEIQALSAIADPFERAERVMMAIEDSADVTRNTLNDIRQRNAAESFISENNIETVNQLNKALNEAFDPETVAIFQQAINEQLQGQGALGLDKLIDPEFLIKAAQRGFNTLEDSAERARDIAKENEEIAKNTLEFRESIADEVKVQSALTEAVLDGEIRTTEQFDRRLDLERLLIQAKKDGLNLTEAEVEAQFNAARKAAEQAEDLRIRVADLQDFIEGNFEDIGDILSDSISDALLEGRGSFADFFADVGEMLVRSGIQELIAQIFSPQGNSSSLAQSFLSGLIGGFAGGSSGAVAGDSSLGLTPVVGVGSPGFGTSSAKGNVFNSPGVSSFGEQGPEAILPLGRDPSGRLGVRTTDQGSSGQSVTINNNITVNGSDNPQETARSTSRALDQLMERKFKSLLINESRSGNLLGGTR